MNGTPPPQVSPTFIEATTDGDHLEEHHHHQPEEQQVQKQEQHQEKSSSSSSNLFRGSKQGIRKLQKCLSTSVSHYDGGEHHQPTTSSNFPFHSQRSVDIRGYVATSSSSSTSNAAAATAASSLQAASSSSLTSPFILTNTRQYSSFGSTNIQLTIQLNTFIISFSILSNHLKHINLVMIYSKRLFSTHNLLLLLLILNYTSLLTSLLLSDVKFIGIIFMVRVFVGCL